MQNISKLISFLNTFHFTKSRTYLEEPLQISFVDYVIIKSVYYNETSSQFLLNKTRKQNLYISLGCYFVEIFKSGSIEPRKLLKISKCKQPQNVVYELNCTRICVPLFKVRNELSFNFLYELILLNKLPRDK